MMELWNRGGTQYESEKVVSFSALIMPDFEYTIIGAGIVGLAIGAELSGGSRHVLLLEKNERYGLETSSRNSEVIHAGIYYPPGSLKAALCVEGRDLMYKICGDRGISHVRCSKLITASEETELPALEKVFQNGKQNGVRLRMLTREEALALEPNIRTVGAIHSPDTGIVSAHELMDAFARQALDRGAMIQFRCEVTGISRQPGGFQLTIRENGMESAITSEKVINAAGLHSDEVAALAGLDIDEAGYRLSYAKGSYFAVTPSKANLVSRLVYPVPLNEGLGVHAVRDWGGRLKFGPDVEYLATRNLDYTVDASKAQAFAESVRRILPAITVDDLTPDMSGIRPKLQKKGEPPRDFVIRHEANRGLEGLVNLIGMDSPGLTASPAIARHVARLLR